MASTGRSTARRGNCIGPICIRLGNCWNRWTTRQYRRLHPGSSNSRMSSIPRPRQSFVSSRTSAPALAGTACLRIRRTRRPGRSWRSPQANPGLDRTGSRYRLITGTRNNAARAAAQRLKLPLLEHCRRRGSMIPQPPGQAVPKMRSPASPRPGTMYPRSFSRSSMAAT